MADEQQQPSENLTPIVIAVAIGAGVLLLSSKGAPPTILPPPEGTITITSISSRCQGQQPITEVDFSSATTDSQFHIVMDGVTVDTVTHSPWISSTTSQVGQSGSQHSYQVIGVTTNIQSNTAPVTTASCVSPPPSGQANVSAVVASWS